MVQSRFRLQDEDEHNRYMNQLYGGRAPTMDYYSQLGRQTGEARARARARENRTQAQAGEDASLDDLIAQMNSMNPPQASAPPASQDENDRGFFNTLGGMIGSVGGMAGEGITNAFDMLNPFNNTSMDDIRQRTQESQAEREQEQGYKDARNYVHSTTSGATFGGLQNPDYVEDGMISTLGNLTGSLFPMAGIQRGIQGTRAAANTTRGMSHKERALRRGREGATIGATYGGLDAAASEFRDPDERDFGDHVKNIALETAFGGAIDPVVGRLADLLPSARRASTQQQQEPEAEELLALPEPARQLPEPAQQLPEPALQLPEPREPFDPAAMTRTRENFGTPEVPTTAGRMDNMNDILNIQNTQRQLASADEMLNTRAREFDSETSAQVQETRVRQEELQKSYKEMEDAFVEAGVAPAEKAVADASSQWQNIKDTRKRYKEVIDTVSDFRIPDLYKEEYGSLVPRNFIRNNSGSDIFDAAAEAGFPPGHEGALEFAHFLRNGSNANKTTKKSLVPHKEADIENMRNTARQDFAQTEDAQGLQSVIDSYDTQIEQLRNQDFQTTEEFNDTQAIIEAMQEQVESLTQQLRRTSTQPSNVLADLGILQPGNNAGTVPPPRRGTQPQPQTQGQPPVEASARLQPETQVQLQSQSQPQQGINDPDLNTFDRGDGGIETNSNLDARSRVAMRATDDIDAIKYTEQALGRTENEMYEAGRLTRGATGASEFHINKTLDPAVAELRNSGKLLEGNQYIMDKHLLRVKELNPEYRIPNNKSVEAMQRNVARHDADPDIQKYSQQVRQYQREVLDMLEAEGLVSREAKSSLIEQYPDYIPLFRSLGKRKKGDKKPLDEIFESYEKLNRGNVRKAIMELSEFGSEQVTNRPIDNLVQYGINAQHAIFNNRMMKKLTNMDGEKLNGKYVAKKITKANEKSFPKENIVSFFEEGKSVRYYVNDDIHRSLENLKGVAQFDEVAGFFHGVAKVQRQSITANPFFSMRQLVRDIPQAWVVGDFNIARDLVPAFMDMITNGRALGNNSMLEDFYKHGAGMSNVTSFDRSQHTALQKASKELKQRNVVEVGRDEIESTMKSLFDRVRRFNEVLENTPKMAQFRATARKTGDLDHAAFKGRDIMDFSRSGESVRNINRYAAFINATIQGRSKQFRSMKKPETWLKTAFVGAVPSIMAYQATQMGSEQQKQIINESPEWQRQTYWLFPNPANDTDVLRIPKPYEVAALVSTPLEFILNNEDKVGTEPKEALQEWASQAIYLDMSMNPASPIYEQILGKDMFTGQDIVPQTEQDLPANEQQDVNTNPLARLAGNIPGVSPRRVEHAIDGYVPVAGEMIGDWANQGLEAAGLKENQAPAGSRYGSIPLASDFNIRGEDYQANTLIGQAYDTTNQLQTDKSQMQQEGQQFPYHNAYRASRGVTTQDSEYARQLRSIANDPNLSADEKRDRRRQILEQRNENIRNASNAGMFEEENLPAMEQNFAPLGAETTKADQFTMIEGQLVNAGVPRVDAEELLNLARENNLSNAEIAELVTRYLQSR